MVGRHQRRLRLRLSPRSALRARERALAFAVILGVASPAWADTSGQAGAQQSAGNTSNTAAMLGEAAGVLSMASGGLFIAKGAQELGCCMQGCSNGSGQQSVSTATQQSQTNTTNAQKLASSQGVSPTGILPSMSLGSSSGSKGNSCLDGALALATGGLMMADGIMGLEAANQAAQNGAASLANADDMGNASSDAISGLGAPTATSSGTTNSALGSAGSGTPTVQLDPALLRTGLANNIMGQFESQFGIPRDTFAQDVLGGQDPRQLLNSAPSNPLSNSDMNKALAAAKNMSEADKAKALAGTQLASAQDELATKLDGAGTRSPAGKKDAFSKPFEAVEADASANSETGVSVSPEIQAALLAKQQAEADASKVDWELLSLFERVHGKYREKAKMIFGYDPDGAVKGVGNANGT